MVFDCGDNIFPVHKEKIRKRGYTRARARKSFIHRRKKFETKPEILYSPVSLSCHRLSLDDDAGGFGGSVPSVFDVLYRGLRNFGEWA